PILEEAAGFLQDDEGLLPVLVPGLMMPRPELAAGNEYPILEKEIRSVQATVAAWQRLNPDQARAELEALHGKLSRGAERVDLPAVPRRRIAPEKMLERRPLVPGLRPARWMLPDACLLRFLDPTVQPGQIYKYRIRIRMANPHSEKKEDAVLRDKQIVAKRWTEIGEPVVVPNDVNYYAVDAKAGQKGYAQPDRDTTVVQIHRWLESVGQRPDAPRDQHYPVGDWSIAERLFVKRGDMI